ncbi:MAG TPA: hypothetical protein DEP07_11100 [Brevibacillus sp.]|uniref:hypothetical protein n=1 Tax=Brevibacillus TaxID=55080 RepID=UPI000EB90268|nr:hypothetical protein [Brevibacillus sp.]HBZ80919.1 hypothetical protein [Brevibacillus sp.]
MARRTRSRRANVTISEVSRIPEIRAKLEELAENEVHIGMQGDAELAMIAGVHEYGSIKMKIPARSFIGVGKKRATSPITKRVKSGVQAIAESAETARDLLRDIGEIGLERTLKRFDSIRQPPLSQAYKAVKRGSKKILLRDKDLRDSLTYKIVRKGGGA